MYVCACVRALYINQSESVAALDPSGVGWIYDTFWIASRRVARAAMVGFAQVRKKEKMSVCGREQWYGSRRSVFM